MNLIPTTEITDQRNMDAILAYEAAMQKRDIKDRETPVVQFYKGCVFVQKRPVDTEVADGKKQRVFYNPVQVYGRLAAAKSAGAKLAQQRPQETRDFPDGV